MLSVFDSVDECCGCEACRQICPKQCISMHEDDKGFRYPVIDQGKCIDCGLCRKSCFYHHEIVKNQPTECYVYVNNDEQYRLASASSGAFEAVCRAFAQGKDENELRIFGCTLTPELIACHDYSEGFAGIGKFKKSKYLQSRIGDSFARVRDFLKAGKTVIFSGTPCQVMGLKSFLKRDYPNLLLIDILCHGVPSQKVFSKYIYSLERKYHSKVKDYIFRYKIKDTSGQWGNLYVKVTFRNGKSAVMSCSEDIYMNAFLAGLLNRDACYKCPFATTDRVSDITLGDFWGIENFMPEFSEFKTNGTSLLLFNTPKAFALKDALSADAALKSLPLEAAIPFNGQLSHPMSYPPKRDIFYMNLNRKNGFMKGMEACYPERYGWRVELRNKLYSSRWYQTLSRLKNSIFNNFH